MQSSPYFGHYEGDTQAYRGPDEVKKVKEECDCIVMLTAAIIRAYACAAAELERIDTQVLRASKRRSRYAQSAAKPNLSDLLTDVYVSY